MKKISKKNEEGSMGIGALIIFIALILVAAIAAAVIIQTANHVRDTAEHTSDRISEQFLGMFNVISIYGNRTTSNGTLNNVETLTITTKVVSSANIDLRHIAISIVTTDKVSRLLLSSYVSSANTDTYNDAKDLADSSHYSVYLPNRGSSSPWNPPDSYSIGANEVVVFVISLEDTGQPLSSHTTFEIHFSDTFTGTNSKLTATTPAGYDSNDEWVRIYPPL